MTINAVSILLDVLCMYAIAGIAVSPSPVGAQNLIVRNQVSRHVQTTSPQQLGAPIIRCPDAPKVSKTVPVETATFKDGNANFKGIQFSWDAKLAIAVLASARPINPLRCSADVPVYNTAPAHSHFSFVGTHKAWQEDGSYRVAELRVYPVAAYRQVFAISNSESVRRFVDDGLNNLEQTLINKTMAFERDAPFLLFRGESRQMYQAKVHYLSFKNGQGLAYITAYGSNQSRPQAEEKHLWVFQGLTKDRQHLVLAVFPIGTLASAQMTKTKGAAPLTMSKQFDNLSDQMYSPNLKFFDEVIQSLVVGPQ